MLNNETMIHIYDHEKGRLYLNNGKEVKVPSKLFKTAEDALEPLTLAARRKGLIASNDLVATFSA